MAILETNKPVTLSQREVAVVVAQAVAKTGLPVPSGKLRNDVNHIQIDPIILERRVTNPKTGVRLQFDTKEDFGVTLNVDLDEFAESPVGYLNNLFDHLGPMLRNSTKMRKNRKLFDSAVYDILTQGAAGHA